MQGNWMFCDVMTTAGARFSVHVSVLVMNLIAVIQRVARTSEYCCRLKLSRDKVRTFVGGVGNESSRAS